MAAPEPREGARLLAILLRQQFDAQEYTDMTVRLVLVDGGGADPGPPSPKRRRTIQLRTDEPPASARVVEIRAHTNVLCAWSGYFRRALAEEWRGPGEPRVTLQVEDEQHMEDLRLLIKLCYADSFVHDDEGDVLPVATRLRLAVCADFLLIEHAVDQVVASLRDASFEDAPFCLGELPNALALHWGIDDVQRKAVTVLAQGIANREGQAEEAAAVDSAVKALAAHLGRVVGMFKPAAPPADMRTLSLREDVLSLPTYAFERLLMSDALQLQSENEAYTLLRAWIERSPSAEDDKQEVFNDLAPVLRYHHMTPDFLACVVCSCEWMGDSGLLATVLSSALVQRDALSGLLRAGNIARGASDRGVDPTDAIWKVKAKFTLQDVMRIEPGGGITKACGLASGYIVTVGLQRRPQDDDGDTLWAFIFFQLPSQTKLDMGPQLGVGFKTVIHLPTNTKLVMQQYFDTLGWGRRLGLWADVVREGSPLFPDGQLELRVTIKAADEHGLQYSNSA